MGLGGCSAESVLRGPAIRYALPFRPPERSRGTTGRPALRPFGAGAAHLAAAAPKRARRPGALHAGCGELSAKRLPLRGITPQRGHAGFGKMELVDLHRIAVRIVCFGAALPTFPFPPHHR